MATSPNYSWPEPDNTDLVKNGALAIRTLGNAIDTTMATMVPKTIVDAKGDLIAGTAADTTARLAVGNNGETLVADSSTATGLRYQANFAAGKNKIINGDFGIWQRGTSFSVSNSSAYTADRFFADNVGTCTVSQQTFTAGTAPVAGYEGQYFLRFNQTVAGAGFIIQKIEDVRQFAGQTITVSVWAKAGATLSLAGQVRQNFGSGGSASVNTTLSTQSVTTSWARYSWTIAVPSVTGLTIGTSSFLQIRLDLPATGTYTFDTWGWQVEAGSVATAFQTATGTIQGELAACQRYYASSWNAYDTAAGGGVNAWIGLNVGTATTGSLYQTVTFPVPMRTAATLTVYDVSGTPASGKVYKGANGKTAVANYVTSRQAVVGTDDVTPASYLLFGYTASAEL